MSLTQKKVKVQPVNGRVATMVDSTMVGDASSGGSTPSVSEYSSDDSVISFRSSRSYQSSISRYCVSGVVSQIGSNGSCDYRSQISVETSATHERRNSPNSISLFETTLWNVYVCILTVFVRLFRISNREYEENRRAFAIFCVNSAVLLGTVFVSTVIIAMEIEDVIVMTNAGIFSRKIISWIVYLMVVFFLMLNFFILAIFKRTQWVVFFLNVTLALSLNFMHFWRSYKIGVYEGSPILVVLLTVVVAHAHGKNFDFFFWSLFFALNIIAAFIHNVFTTPSKILAVFESIDDNSVTEITVRVFFSYPMFFVVLMTIFIFEKVRRRKEEEIVNHIGNCILTLDFEAEHLKEFEKRDERFCNRFEILFKCIIFNLRLYKSYLPGEFRHKLKRARSENDSISSSNTIGSLNSETSSSSTPNVYSEILENRRRSIVVDYSIDVKEEVIMVLFTVIGFFHSFDLEAIKTFVTEFVNVVSFNVEPFGVVNDISTDGSEILCSFNAYSPTREVSSVGAVRIAVEVQSVLAERFPNIEIGACVVENAESFVGNVESPERSNFYIIGKHVEIFERMKAIQKGRILVDTVVFEKSKLLFEFAQIEYDEKIGTGIYQL